MEMVRFDERNGCVAVLVSIRARCLSLKHLVLDVKPSTTLNYSWQMWQPSHNLLNVEFSVLIFVFVPQNTWLNIAFYETSERETERIFIRRGWKLSTDKKQIIFKNEFSTSRVSLKSFTRFANYRSEIHIDMPLRRLFLMRSNELIRIWWSSTFYSSIWFKGWRY